MAVAAPVKVLKACTVAVDDTKVLDEAPAAVESTAPALVDVAPAVGDGIGINATLALA